MITNQATTEMLQALKAQIMKEQFDEKYPVGKGIYIQFQGMQEPSVAFAKYGATWTRDNDYAGRVLVGYGATSANPTYKGTYSSTTQYYQNEIVSFSGNYFVAVKNTKGNSPSNTTYWKLYSLGATGGEYQHVSTINEMPDHNHASRIVGEQTSSFDHIAINTTWGRFQTIIDLVKEVYNHSENTEPHNNMQPYKVVGVWKRTA